VLDAKAKLKKLYHDAVWAWEKQARDAKKQFISDFMNEEQTKHDKLVEKLKPRRG
jgi:hypothetical protein